jgi:hypothetical protein
VEAERAGDAEHGARPGDVGEDGVEHRAADAGLRRQHAHQDALDDGRRAIRRFPEEIA